ncbi:hypothetical protein VTK26DRAFT_7793 [Humicola hyalothermophila]
MSGEVQRVCTPLHGLPLPSSKEMRFWAVTHMAASILQLFCPRYAMVPQDEERIVGERESQPSHETTNDMNSGSKRTLRAQYPGAVPGQAWAEADRSYVKHQRQEEIIMGKGALPRGGSGEGTCRLRKGQCFGTKLVSELLYSFNDTGTQRCMV